MLSKKKQIQVQKQMGSKRMEKDILCNTTVPPKRAEVAILVTDQIVTRATFITREKAYFVMIRGAMYEEDIAIIKVHVMTTELQNI